MPKLTTNQIKELLERSYDARVNILKMMKKGEGHIGGAFSALDIITVLYAYILKFDPKRPKWKERDRFILSAGHKALALYPTLAESGYFNEEILWTYNSLKTKVSMHPDHTALPGVEFSTGSLGHGLAIASGIALNAKIGKEDYKVFTLLGDGECSEGSVWEAAMSAAHYKLDNLTTIVDKNDFQVNGKTETIMDSSDLGNKFKSFGWKVKNIDGHDFSQIYDALLTIPFKLDKPSCIIANTTKCKGLPFGEKKFEFHHWHCPPDEIDSAIEIVEDIKEKEYIKVGS